MKKYSAGMVSHAFWLNEFSQYIDLVNDGISKEEIKNKGLEDNYFKQSSKVRAKRMIGVLDRRVESLDEDYWELYPKLDVNSQKVVNLIAIMNNNQLFKEFMYEIYRDELIVGDAKLYDYEVESFFNQKVQESEQIAKWTDVTIKRLTGVFKTFNREAGLLKDQGKYDDVIRPVIDYRLEDLLVAKKNNEMLAILLGR